jgi:hypothetical protein
MNPMMQGGQNPMMQQGQQGIPPELLQKLQGKKSPSLASLPAPRQPVAPANV